MRAYVKRTARALRERALERLYELTAKNWHILDTVPLHTISQASLQPAAHHFGSAQIHDPRGAARFWPDAPPALRHHLEPQVIPRPYMLTLTDALVSNFTVATLADIDHVPIEIFPEVMRSREHIHFMDKTRAQRRSLARQHRDRAPDHHCGYLFGAIGWQNYYHTIVDHALRYAEFREAGQIPQDAMIILPQATNGYQTAFLDLLDIPAERRVFADKGCVKLSRLLVPSIRRHGRAVSRSGIEAFRNAVLACLPEPPKPGPKRVYLSRKDAQTRRVLNEPEVEALLHAHGFDTVQPEHMSLVDQIGLFSQADMIAGPHGAGLSNAIFAKSPHVIEFLPADLWDLGYFVGLTTSCGGTYDGIVGTGRSADDDIVVDLAALKGVLER